MNLCEYRTSLAVGGRLNLTVASTSNEHSFPSLRVPQTNTVKNSGCSGDEEGTQMCLLLVKQYLHKTILINHSVPPQALIRLVSNAAFEVTNEGKLSIRIIA